MYDYMYGAPFAVFEKFFSTHKILKIYLYETFYEVKLFDEVFYCTITFQFKLFMLSLMHSSLNHSIIDYHIIIIIHYLYLLMLFVFFKYN